MDLALVKLYPNGSIVWNITWGGSDYDRGEDLFIGQDGSIYACGWTSSYSVGDSDLLLIKFYPNGTLAWNVTWGGPGIEYGFDLGLNSDGFIYVCGSTISYGLGLYDLALVKFSMNGTLVYNITWGGNASDRSSNLEFGSDGSIYLSGYTSSYGPGIHALSLVKFYPNGTLIWNVTWGGIGDEFGNDLVVSNGYIYVVGTTNSYGSGDNDLSFLKFNTDGTKLFNTTWGGPNNDDGYTLITDNYGKIYAVGDTKSFGAGSYDLEILNFDSEGNIIWNETWGSVDEEKPMKAIITNEGYLYVCGYTNHSTLGGYDFLLVNYKKVYIPQQSQPVPAFELLYAFISLVAIICFIKLKNRRITSKYF
ncbi:MAG: hypothetical protein ACTSPY_14815 [Candidatus Helarchaeota archaeon]